MECVASGPPGLRSHVPVSAGLVDETKSQSEAQTLVDVSSLTSTVLDSARASNVLRASKINKVQLAFRLSECIVRDPTCLEEFLAVDATFLLVHSH